MLERDFNVTPKIHNFFDFECRDVTTGELIQKAHAENVVLDKWYAAMLSTNDPSFGVYKIAIGSNGDTPSKTDTGLKSFIGAGGIYARDTSALSVGGTGILKFNGTWTIDATTYVGQYFREVGAANYSGASNKISTRAVLKDSNGNPLEILKTDTMVVTIYSTVYIVIPETINGYKYKPTNIWSYPNDNYTISFMGPFGEMVFTNARLEETWKTPSVVRPMVVEKASFSAGFTVDLENKLRTFSLNAIEANNANLNGGIRAVLLNGLEIPLPNASFPQSPIIKEVVGSGDGNKKEFATEFGFIRNNGTLRVYVNDVETLDFTATFDTPPLSAKFLGFIRKPPMGGQNNVVEKITPYQIISYYMPSYDNSTLFCSNDGVVWENLGTVSAWSPTVIPTQFRNYKYWAGKHLWNEAAMSSRSDLVMSGGDIVLNTPPPVGSTITVTYQPDCIAKNNQKLIKNISYKIGLDY